MSKNKSDKDIKDNTGLHNLCEMKTLSTSEREDRAGQKSQFSFHINQSGLSGYFIWDMLLL